VEQEIQTLLLQIYHCHFTHHWLVHFWFAISYLV